MRVPVLTRWVTHKEKASGGGETSLVKSAAAIRTQMRIARRQAEQKKQSIVTAERKMAQDVLKRTRSMKPKQRFS